MLSQMHECFQHLKTHFHRLVLVLLCNDRVYTNIVPRFKPGCATSVLLPFEAAIRALPDFQTDIPFFMSVFHDALSVPFCEPIWKISLFFTLTVALDFTLSQAVKLAAHFHYKWLLKAIA